MNPLLLGVGLSSACVAGVVATRAGARRRAPTTPVVTVACFAVIFAVSLAQLTIAPGLLPLLMRDGSRVAAGEPWRLATSLLVQDGGWAGAAVNLVGLLAVGAVAERMLGPRRWALTAAISVAAAQTVALDWQPTGAGNSILDFALVGAVCAACLTMRPPRRALVPASVALACVLLLFLRRDIHGVAGASAALVGFAWSVASRT